MMQLQSSGVLNPAASHMQGTGGAHPARGCHAQSREPRCRAGAAPGAWGLSRRCGLVGGEVEKGGPSCVENVAVNRRCALLRSPISRHKNQCHPAAHWQGPCHPCCTCPATLHSPATPCHPPSKGGSPYCSGRNSSREGRMLTHPAAAAGSGAGYMSEGCPPFCRMLGTATTRMPAAVAAATPAGASSITRQAEGGRPSRCATAMKQSGAGLPFCRGPSRSGGGGEQCDGQPNPP